jgi:hypothetical protein
VFYGHRTTDERPPDLVSPRSGDHHLGRHICSRSYLLVYDTAIFDIDRTLVDSTSTTRSPSTGRSVPTV